MRRMVFTFIIFALCFSAVSCGSGEKLPVKTVTEYADKKIEMELPLRLKLDCEYCKLEIYRWKEHAVKFEYTASVTGEFTTEKLREKLKCFTIKTQTDGRDIAFRSEYSDSNKTEGKLKLRVYIPQKVDCIELLCVKGNFKSFDDLKGDLVIRAGNLDVDINKLEGKLDCSIEEGDIRLAAGELSNGSTITAGRGNIRIKAGYEPSGTYCFVAREGLLDISLPRKLDAQFTDDLPVALYETDHSNGEYTEVGHSKGEKNQEAASFRLVSGIDRILITRF